MTSRRGFMGMMMTGAGLGGLNPKPMNAPDAPAPSPGVQPGSSGIVTAVRVIVGGTGPGTGVFLYNVPPPLGLGNSPIAWMSNSAVDPFGNALPATGIVSWSSAAGRYSQLSAGTMVLNGASFTVTQAIRVTAPLLGALSFIGANSYYFDNPALFNSQISAIDPSLPFAQETYHSLGTLAGYTVNNAVFWLDAQGNTNFDINVTSLGANALTTVFSVTLPAAYRPTGLSKTYAMASNAGVFSNPRLGITTAGAVSIVFTANTAAGVVGGAVMPRN